MVDSKEGGAAAIAGFFALYVVVVTLGQSLSPYEDEQVNALLEAMRQAQRPSNNIIMEWEYETAGPVARIVSKGHADSIPDPRLMQTKRSYTVTLSGARCRIEYIQETYRSPESKEPHVISRRLYIFDGKQSIQFREPIKSELPTLARPIGRRSAETDMSYLVNRLVFGPQLPLHDPEALRDYDLRLIDGDAEGIYILDAQIPGDVHYRFTVDGDRGYNITKVEHFGEDNEVDWVTEVELKQYADGIWFPVKRHRTRHWPGEGWKTEFRDAVTTARFNVDIPDKTFTFEFPPGTELWDGVLGESFIVGITPEPGLDETVLSIEEQVNTGFQTSEAVQKTPTARPDNIVVPDDNDSGAVPLADTGSSGKQSLILMVLGLFLAVLTAAFVLRRREKVKRTTKVGEEKS